jgi:hypothetical protein
MEFGIFNLIGAREAEKPASLVFSEVAESKTPAFATSDAKILDALRANQWTLSDVRSTGLKCEAAPDPSLDYPEHGVITGWDEEKAKRIVMCQELVARHKRVLNSP